MRMHRVAGPHPAPEAGCRRRRPHRRPRPRRQSPPRHRRPSPMRLARRTTRRCRLRIRRSTRAVQRPLVASRPTVAMALESPSMVIYGVNPVREALAANRRPVRRIWATHPQEWPDAHASSALEIEERCGSEDHQGVCAEVGPYPYADAEALLEPDDALVVVLDQIQDPRNLGAVTRVAECAGASGLVIPERRSAEV